MSSVLVKIKYIRVEQCKDHRNQQKKKKEGMKLPAAVMLTKTPRRADQ